MKLRVTISDPDTAEVYDSCEVLSEAPEFVLLDEALERALNVQRQRREEQHGRHHGQHEEEGG